MNLESINIDHLCTLFYDAHERALDNILSHPLKADQIEDLADSLGLCTMADQLREDRREEEERNNDN